MVDGFYIVIYRWTESNHISFFPSGSIVTMKRAVLCESEWHWNKGKLIITTTKLILTATMSNVMSNRKRKNTIIECRKTFDNNKNISLSVLCRFHYILSITHLNCVLFSVLFLHICAVCGCAVPCWPNKFRQRKLKRSSGERNAMNNCTDIDSVKWTDPGNLISLAVLAFINVLVIVGNCLVIAAVFCSHKLRNVTNFFIVSLAVADLLVGIAVLPFSATWEVFKVLIWPFFFVCARHSFNKNYNNK